MHINRDTDWERLTRYFLGDATAEERAVVESWIEASPERASEITALRQRWESVPAPVDAAALETAWQQLQHTLHGSPVAGTSHAHGSSASMPRKKSSWRTPAPRWQMATNVFLALGCIAAVWGGRSWYEAQRKTALASNTMVQHYQAASGQRATFMLPDGTRAILAPQTTMDIDDSFGQTTRTITLQGEAYFEVASTRNAPFIVRTGAVMTQVLGTAFSVRRYPGDETARIAVVTGKVRISTLRAATEDWSPLLGLRGSMMPVSGAVLAANMLGVIDDSGSVRVTPNVSIDDYTAWATGRLVFQKTPVREIILELGRAYDVDIRLADSALAKRTLTWTVPVQQRSLDGVLGSLVTALGAHVTRSGRTITIVPGSLVLRKLIGPHNSNTSERNYGR